jgi:hypothetical protein
MHRRGWFLQAARPAADRDTLERLLAGRLDAADAPPGYAELAKLLAAATRPATQKELGGEQVLLAEFAAVMQSPPPTLVPRRATVLSKLTTARC